MSASTKGSDHSIRPSKPFCLFGFVAASALVFWWGYGRDYSSVSTQQHTATAKIYRQIGLATAIAEAEPPAVRLAELANPAPDRVAAQLTSEALLHRALRQVGASGGSETQVGTHGRSTPDIAVVRENLQVTVDEAAGPDELEITIRYTDSDADRSVRLVNRLAESYAADFRDRWRSRAQEVAAHASDAAENARRALRKAQQQLDTSIQQSAKETPETWKPMEATRPGTPETRSGTLEIQGTLEIRGTLENGAGNIVENTMERESANTDNPEWLALQERLAQVISHRDALLIDRTPLHPAVQEAELQISGLQKRLASISRQIPVPSPDPLPSLPERSETSVTDANIATQQSPSAQAVPSVPPQRRADEVAKLRELERTVEEADEAYRRAVRKERDAWLVGQRIPRVELDLARLDDTPATQGPGVAVLLATLIAGLAGAAGTGMVSLGWAMEPTFNTVDEVGRIVPAPVIGVVSQSGLPRDRPEPADRRQWLRPILILGGIVLIGGCISMAIHMLGV